MLVSELIAFQLHIDTSGNRVEQLGLGGLDHSPRSPRRQSYGGQHNISGPLTSAAQAAYAPGKTAEMDKAACAGEWVLTPAQLRCERLS